MNKIIREIECMVEETCKKETNYFGYSIWPNHIVHVVQYAKMLAKKIDADQEIVEISALLHDYASVKDFKYFEEHHIHGASFAQEILLGYNYPNDKIEAVKHCILTHSGGESRRVSRNSKEAQCIADADAMAHFNAIGSLFYLAFNSHKLDIIDSEKWLLSKLERGWNKLSPIGKEIIEEKYHAAKILFTHV